MNEIILKGHKTQTKQKKKVSSKQASLSIW